MPDHLLKRHTKDQVSTIAFSAFMLIVPMTFLVALLLGLTLLYRVHQGDESYENLKTAETDMRPEDYYVNISATRYVIVASLSSTLAPLLGGFILALATYPICRSYMRQAQSNNLQNLLTPYQLALALGVLSGGGFGAYWKWLKYLHQWRRTRSKQGRALKSVLCIALLGTLLGFIAIASDTWLHITTKTVVFSKIQRVYDGVDYNFVLQQNCTTGNNSFAAQSDDPGACTLNVAATAVFLINGSRSLQVLNNVSNDMAVLSYQADVLYTFLGVPPSTALQQRDYTAQTYGMSTSCTPISSECNLTAEIGASTPFRCNDVFQGEAEINFDITYFTNQSLTYNDTISGIQNPYYFGFAPLVNAGGGSRQLVEQGQAVPEIVIPVHGGTAFVLKCAATMYDIEYDSVNGTVTRFLTTVSNDSVANIWQGTTAYVSGSPGNAHLQQAAGLATFSNTAQAVADKMAMAYSQVALALGSEALTPHPATRVQQRSELLVARVRKAPLYTLVASNLLFVVLGLVLALVAWKVSADEVQDIVSRFSLAGVVADRFESSGNTTYAKNVEDCFQERWGEGRSRVAIVSDPHKGFVYKVLSA